LQFLLGENFQQGTGTFFSNPARNSLLRTYRLKKAAQPEEFASAQLMRIIDQQQDRLGCVLKPAKPGILTYGNE
jgi:hypothetical protein